MVHAANIVVGFAVRGLHNAWINPAAVVGLPLQKTFSAAWVESFVRRLEDMLMLLKTIAVVTDKVSYHQAIYVDDKLVESDSSLYANEVARVSGGVPVIVKEIMCSLDGDTFPDHLDDVVEVEH